MDGFASLTLQENGLLGIAGQTIDLVSEDLDSLSHKLSAKVRVINPTVEPPYYKATFKTGDLTCDVIAQGGWPTHWIFQRAEAPPTGNDSAAYDALLRFYEGKVRELTGATEKSFAWGSIHGLYDDKSGTSYILILIERGQSAR